MVVEVSPQIEEKIAKLVETGSLANSTEVVDRAVELLAEEVEKLDWLRRELAIGEEQELRGEYRQLTRERFEELKLRAREQVKSEDRMSDAVRP